MTTMNHPLIRHVMRNKLLLLMALPAVLYVLIFSYLPMAGLVIAFKQFKYNLGVFHSPWVGFDNFRFFFISGKAFLVTKNTFLYNLVFIILNNVLEIMLGICLYEVTGKYFRKLSQSFLFLPYFISWATVAALFFGFTNYEYGLINGVLKTFGMQPIDILNNVGDWKYIIVFINAWKAIGYGTIFYLAAILGIDQEMFDAAEIDGANLFQRIWHLTLPFLTPAILILVLLAIGNIFRGDFGLFYQLVGDNGLLYNSTDIIDTFVFRSLMQTREEGMAAAVGLYQSVLCFFTIMIANYLVKKYNKDYSLF